MTVNRHGSPRPYTHTSPTPPSPLNSGESSWRLSAPHWACLKTSSSLTREVKLQVHPRGRGRCPTETMFFTNKMYLYVTYCSFHTEGKRATCCRHVTVFMGTVVFKGTSTPGTRPPSLRGNNTSLETLLPFADPRSQEKHTYPGRQEVCFLFPVCPPAEQEVELILPSTGWRGGVGG